MVDRVGQQLGNYRLVRLLGKGGFAEVYLGHHIHLESPAAIKILDTVLPDEHKEGFLTEAKNLIRLRHSRIIRIMEFGIEGDVPFIIMEYAPNGTMRAIQPKGSLVPLDIVISYVKQIADALQYIHNQKLVHRDIKPENILLGPNHEILLSDLGIAAVAHTTETNVLQKQAGTAPYMAPEQIQGMPRTASDQYALGIIVYEWLCGRRPFEGTAWSIQYQHLHTPVPTLRTWAPATSHLIEEVVLKALNKDPKQRFPSVQAFATALEGAYQQAASSRSDSSLQQVSLQAISEAPLSSFLSAPAAADVPFHHSNSLHLPVPIDRSDFELLPNNVPPPQISPETGTQQGRQVHPSFTNPAYRDTPYPITPHPENNIVLNPSFLLRFQRTLFIALLGLLACLVLAIPITYVILQANRGNQASPPHQAQTLLQVKTPTKTPTATPTPIPSPTVAPTPAPDANFSWCTTACTTNGFIVEFPNGWNQGQTSDKIGVQFLNPSSPDVYAAFKTPGATTSTANQLITNDLANFTSQPGYTAPTTTDNTTIGGTNWTFAIAHYTLNNQIERIQVYATVYQGKAYIIELQATESRFDTTYDPTYFQKMINSFQYQQSTT